MAKIKDYVILHLNVMLFSLTGIFSKMASIQYNRQGLKSVMLWIFVFLMLANCGIYAIVWQRVIKKFDLHIAYANRSVYLFWSQIWAVLIFGEHLTANNILGIIIVFAGVILVSLYDNGQEERG